MDDFNPLEEPLTALRVPFIWPVVAGVGRGRVRESPLEDIVASAIRLRLGSSVSGSEDVDRSRRPRTWTGGSVGRCSAPEDVMFAVEADVPCRCGWAEGSALGGIVGVGSSESSEASTGREREFEGSSSSSWRLETANRVERLSVRWPRAKLAWHV